VGGHTVLVADDLRVGAVEADRRARGHLVAAVLGHGDVLDLVVADPHHVLRDQTGTGALEGSRPYDSTYGRRAYDRIPGSCSEAS
jgi:hypothetical protein